MQKWLTWLIMGVWLAYPLPANAGMLQSEIRFSRLSVQLWPEYDQPSMLVIYDFELAAGAPAPARVAFEIPNNANLIAVASLENGNLVDASFEQPVAKKDVRVFTIIVESAVPHHFEYYQPLARNQELRQFDFEWNGDYAVDEFSLLVQQPLDTTSLTTDPPLRPGQDTLNGLAYFASQPTHLPTGTSFELDLEYVKSSDALTVPPADIKASEPIDENTTGRISAGDYWPFIIAAVIFFIIAGGAGYFYMTGRIRRFDPRRRLRRRQTAAPVIEVYCHQCGQRAHAGDRFCRVCGTRLRLGN
jgi:hypothetical protein